ncbi:hypothetical protein MIND_00790600 [Mycena indigotica]|uniref:Uncharacterized protein n=1 Tax=Mycena indigotica TaxID=2126181 RepID=A0A8H6W465_9AGAR|nr:uncharacterized protein MIND_00790600 [Mycena indigotica]KAF7302236.1 hypothetical protein MIND_00790600 [Mycena indigotica]
MTDHNHRRSSPIATTSKRVTFAETSPKVLNSSSSNPSPTKKTQRAKTQSVKKKPPLPSWTRFPEFQPFDTKPPKRGTNIEGKGITPLYVLGWRFSAMDLAAGPSGGHCSGLHNDFVLRWADNLRENFTKRCIQRPLVWQSLGRMDDDDFYYIAGSNDHDPNKITARDFQHAKAALPSFQPWSTVDVDQVFGWYRTMRT